jgi:hypothetical protein
MLIETLAAMVLITDPQAGRDEWTFAADAGGADVYVRVGEDIGSPERGSQRRKAWLLFNMKTDLPAEGDFPARSVATEILADCDGEQYGVFVVVQYSESFASGEAEAQRLTPGQWQELRPDTPEAAAIAMICNSPWPTRYDHAPAGFPPAVAVEASPLRE